MPDIGMDESTAEARSAETGGSWTSRALIAVGVVVFALFLLAGIARLTIRASDGFPLDMAAFWEFIRPWPRMWKCRPRNVKRQWRPSFVT